MTTGRCVLVYLFVFLYILVVLVTPIPAAAMPLPTYEQSEKFEVSVPVMWGMSCYHEYHYRRMAYWKYQRALMVL